MGTGAATRLGKVQGAAAAQSLTPDPAQCYLAPHPATPPSPPASPHLRHALHLALAEARQLARGQAQHAQPLPRVLPQLDVKVGGHAGGGCTGRGREARGLR